MSELMLPELELAEEPEDRNKRFKYLLVKAEPRVMNPKWLDGLVVLADQFAAEVAKNPGKIGWTKKNLAKQLALRNIEGNALKTITDLVVARLADVTLESWVEGEPDVELNTVMTKSQSPYFRSGDGFQITEFVKDLMATSNLAMTGEGEVAVYDKGHYQAADWKLQWATLQMLGNAWTSTCHNEAVKALKVQLYAKGLVLKDKTDEPMLNVQNGMLDLRTGKLLPHDPKYLSSNQLDIAWNPDAFCGFYEWWLLGSLGGKEQVMDDLEETVSQLLDQSKTPTKALLLWGPSRSGKSTFLDILKAMAGQKNTSAVTLHALGDNRFASSQLYGKTLNVAADISAKDVEDIATFKMMLGQDLISAERKGVQGFTFVNRALFAFSCNAIPTVSEGSNAYTARMKPVEFPNSFIGEEDDRMGPRLLEDLPGILVRWVKAWQRKQARGGFMATDVSTAAKFAAGSDRVARFAEQCLVLGDGPATTTSVIYLAFEDWVKENAGRMIGKQQFNQRMGNIPGCKAWVLYRGDGSSNIRGWHVKVRPRDEW